MHIDYSQLQTFISCPRKYKLRMIDCLRKVKYDERDLDLSFGKAIHGALEIIYKKEGLDKAKEWFTANFHGIEGQKVKTPANGLMLLDRYHTYYQQANNDLSDVNLEVLEVEIVDEFKIQDIDYIVKVDTIVKSKAGIFVLEHKTTTKLPYNYFYQFDPNMQISGYCNYVLQKYGQCSGAIINAMVVGYRARAYKGEPAGFHCQFVREIVNRSKEQLKDFEVNVSGWVDKLEIAKSANMFPRNTQACHQFKGCGFKELCSNCDDEQIRTTLYETYDPKEYLK